MGKHFDSNAKNKDTKFGLTFTINENVQQLLNRKGIVDWQHSDTVTGSCIQRVFAFINNGNKELCTRGSGIKPARPGDIHARSVQVALLFYALQCACTLCICKLVANEQRVQQLWTISYVCVPCLGTETIYACYRRRPKL